MYPYRSQHHLRQQQPILAGIPDGTLRNLGRRELMQHEQEPYREWEAQPYGGQDREQPQREQHGVPMPRDSEHGGDARLQPRGYCHGLCLGRGWGAAWEAVFGDCRDKGIDARRSRGSRGGGRGEGEVLAVSLLFTAVSIAIAMAKAVANAVADALAVGRPRPRPGWGRHLWVAIAFSPWRRPKYCGCPLNMPVTTCAACQSTQ